MVSVTGRLKSYKQPYGGFIKVKELRKDFYDDGLLINGEFSVNAIIVGLAVEYLSEYMMGHNKNEIFRVSILGAMNVEPFGHYREYLDWIQGLDDESIISACRLSGYDVAYRHSLAAYIPVKDFILDEKTIQDIKTMVNRTIEFFKVNGPVVMSGMTFKEAYTNKISTGDGDILTATGLWDLKVIKGSPSNKHTLQVLIYYLMGLQSEHKENFENIEKIGLYNPRLNIAYYMNIKDIAKETIDIVNAEVIGY